MPNTIVHQAVEVFSGRLDGITLKTTLADNLPQVRADGGFAPQCDRESHR